MTDFLQIFLSQAIINVGLSFLSFYPVQDEGDMYGTN